MDLELLVEFLTSSFKLGEVSEGEQRLHQSFSKGPRDEAAGTSEAQAGMSSDEKAGESSDEEVIGT